MSFELLVKESFNGLSPGQKKVAEYLLQNIEKAAFSTAVQIGREADVSETTVIRLSYALGFSGFSEMQGMIQKYVLQSSTNRPYGIDEEMPDTEEVNLFSKAIEKDIAILRQTYSQLNQVDLWKAVDLLVQADQVLVVGFRASYAAAHWFSFMLSLIRNNVVLIPFMGEAEEKILTLTEKSVALVISFPRYTKETIRVAEAGKRKGAKIISVTDRVLSPVGRTSDITFTTDVNIETGANSISSILSLLNLILGGIEMKNQSNIQSRMQELEQLYSSWEVFIE